MIVGGALNVLLWPVFTRLHGPTSVDEEGELLGMGTELWGALMEGPSGLLIALGLAGSYGVLTRDGGRMTRIGFWLALVALAVPGIVNTVTLALWPPLLAPIAGLGLVLVAAGNRHGQSVARPARFLLTALGAILLFTFTWAAVVRPDLIDRIDGYRIQGLLANVLYGIGWIALGSVLLRSRRRG